MSIKDALYYGTMHKREELPHLALVSPAYTEIRLNLGCGNDIRRGFVNVDMHGSPDLKFDLNQPVWPWDDNSVSEVEMRHVLEHLPNTVMVMRELYRICKHEAKIHITVPHPRHDDFISDPTHCSPITAKMMHLFSKKDCEHWKSAGAANTPLALIHKVDFDVFEETFNVDQVWMDKVNTGKLTMAQLHEMAILNNNVVREIELRLVVRK